MLIQFPTTLIAAYIGVILFFGIFIRVLLVPPL